MRARVSVKVVEHGPEPVLFVTRRVFKRIWAGPRVPWDALNSLLSVSRSARASLFSLKVHNRGNLSTKKWHLDNLGRLPFRVHQKQQQVGHGHTALALKEPGVGVQLKRIQAPRAVVEMAERIAQGRVPIFIFQELDPLPIPDDDVPYRILEQSICLPCTAEPLAIETDLGTKRFQRHLPGDVVEDELCLLELRRVRG